MNDGAPEAAARAMRSARLDRLRARCASPCSRRGTATDRHVVSEQPDDLVVQRPRGPVLPAGRLLHRPLAAGRARRHHARARRPLRAAATAHYLAAAPAEGVLRTRLGDEIDLQTLPYGEAIEHHGVRARLHPAGHVLGSAQVRLEHGGQVWVASGDYYSPARSTRARTTRPARRSSRCAATASSPSRPSACRSTAGSRRRELFADIDAWWRGNAEAGRASLLPRLQLRQGAAHPARRRPLDRADLRARRGRAAEPRLPRRRRRRCRRRRWSPRSTDKALLPRAPCRRAAVGAGLAPGCAASASTATPSPAAGCSCAARAGAARSTAASCSRDHADWPGLQRAIARDRRRARHRHARLRGGDGALAARAGPGGRARSRPSTATTTTRPTRPRRSGAASSRHEALRRASSPSSTRAPSTHAKVEALQALLRRGRRRATPPGRCTSSPAASRARSCRAACCGPLACERAGIARLAVRRVLPGRRRPRRDRRARAAAAPRTRATSAWPSGSRSACCRCAACRPKSRPRRVRRVLGRARQRRAASC